MFFVRWELQITKYTGQLSRQFVVYRWLFLVLTVYSANILWWYFLLYKHFMLVFFKVYLKCIYCIYKRTNCTCNVTYSGLKVHMAIWHVRLAAMKSGYNIKEEGSWKPHGCIHKGPTVLCRKPFHFVHVLLLMSSHFFQWTKAHRNPPERAYILNPTFVSNSQALQNTVYILLSV